MSALLVLCLLPDAPFKSAALSWSPSLPATVKRLTPPGGVVVTDPPTQLTHAGAMTWEAIDGMSFSLVGGYANIPTPGEPYGEKWVEAPPFIALMPEDPAIRSGFAEPSSLRRAIAFVTGEEADLRSYLAANSAATFVFTGVDAPADGGGSIGYDAARTLPPASYWFLTAALGPPEIVRPGYVIWLAGRGGWSRRARGVRTGEALLDRATEPDAALPAQRGTGGAAKTVRGHASGLAILALVAIPAVVFGGADLLGGHLLLSGDNLIQNYPLRVLVGSQLRAGTLPALDPYVWSGTPLAAGLNAGAFFPTTLLFAVLPAHVAWVLGDVLAYASAAVGTYLLFRTGGASVRACFLGACTFAFAGAVAAQTSVHIDMGDGIACLPWAVLAVRRIVEDGRWRWAVLLGAALGLCILGGSPEALLGTIAACATYGLLRWSVLPGAGARFLTRSIAAVGLAAGGSAFVWIPALRFIAESQRGVVTEAAASGYSFPPRAAVLAVVPFLEGGYHLFSQSAYFGPSNYSEVTLYVGILPLVAALGLASRRWSAWLPPGERRCWYGLLAVAVVLAVGASTPLEHILYQIPFYGHQRDSGRAVVEVDLAASALLTWWLDGGSRPAGARSRLEEVAALVPLGLVIVAGSWFALSPSTLWQALGTNVATPRATGIGAAIGVAAALGAAAAAVTLARPRLGRTWWLRLASVAVLVDLALFTGGTAYASSEAVPDAAHPGPVISLVEKSLSSGGRYAVFDPGLFDPAALATAGEPDVGILEQLPAATGYGSLVDADYVWITDTTARDYIEPQGIATGRYADIGLQVLVTVPESFLTPTAGLAVSGTPKTLSEPPGEDPALPGGNILVPDLPVVPQTSPPRPAITQGQVASWWFGAQIEVTTALLRFPPSPRAQLVRAGVLGMDGAVRWAATEQVAGGSDEVVFRLDGSPAAGLAVQLLGSGTLGPLQPAVATSRRAYLVDGALAGAVGPGTWREVGASDGLVVFQARARPRTAWLEPPSTPAPTTTAGGSAGAVHVVSTSAAAVTVDVVSGTPARLVVGTAYDAGWQAEVSGADGTHAVAVERSGLVEAVDVPAGRSLVTLTYRPPGFSLGLLLTVVTAGLFVVACLAGFLTRRRRATRPRTPDQAAATGGR